MRSARALALVVLVGAWLAPAAGAQSLGEVAKKEAERRGAVPATGKVFTNGDLKPDPTAPAPTVPTATSDAPVDAPKASGATAGDHKTADAAATDPDQEGVTPRDLQEPQAASDKGEDFWRGRANMHKSRLASQNAEIEALRQRLASLPPAADNPERAIATRVLSKAVDDLKSFNDEWMRFQQQARDRKIPDAWIR